MRANTVRPYGGCVSMTDIVTAAYKPVGGDLPDAPFLPRCDVCFGGPPKAPSPTVGRVSMTDIVTAAYKPVGGGED